MQLETRHSAWILAAFITFFCFMLVACGGGGGSSSASSGSGTTAPAVSITSVLPVQPIISQAVQFTASGSGNGSLSYAWNFGDGQSGAGASTSHTYAQKGTYTVAVTLTDNTGATATANATVVVSPVPVSATISSTTPASPLNGQQVTFLGTGTGQGALTYDWSFGDGATGNGAGANHTYTTAGPYAVTLTVTDSAGTSKTATTNITVLQDSPTASVSASTNSPDATETVTFTGSGTGSGTLSYVWNFGDGSAPVIGTTVTHAYSSTGSYTVSLSVTDALGHAGIATSTISVASNAPTAAISPQVVSTTVGLATTFHGVGTGQSPVSYVWNFGDSSATTAGANPTHIFTATGNYTVTLTVTDAAGLTAIATDTVAVNYPPVAASIVSISSNPTAGKATTFDGSASGGTGSYTIYAWDFGDGTTGSGVAPSHTYAAAGSYTVSLAVTDSANTTSPAVTSSITVIDPPAPSALTITPSSATPSINSVVSFTGVASGANPLTYSWDFGDGGPAAAGATATHTYTVIGSYTVTMTVTDTFGQTAQATATIVATAPETAGLAFLAGSAVLPSAANYGASDFGSYMGGEAIDSAGNVYVAVTRSHVIDKITPAGMVSTLAGTVGTSGSADGVGTAASFNQPNGVAVDGAGNIYVADTGNHEIRKITPGGVVTTLAGNAANNTPTDGVGTAAAFNSPLGIAINSAGTLYVSDNAARSIRKVTSSGVVTTLAANSTGHFIFDAPEGLAVDASGNVYVADRNQYQILKVTSAGVVSTFAGSGTTATVDGTGTAASFQGPTSVTLDSNGNFYVADLTTVRAITPAGVVTTLAGNGNSVGAIDATGTYARFSSVYAIALDSAGTIFVTDGQFIREITPSGTVTSFAGRYSGSGAADGMGIAARFSSPTGIAVDSLGNAYVADKSNDIIRKITPTGIVSTLAGLPGTSGIVDGTGVTARFNHPNGVAVDSTGNVYVADTSNDTIRKITASGVVTTLAGTAGVHGMTDGTGAAASFNTPQGIAVDTVGNVYVADTFNDAIRKITPAGEVTTLEGGSFGSADGTGTAAKFNNPVGVAVDGAGNVFIADASNFAIRKITPAGVVTTLASVMFGTMTGITIDSSGNLYVADSSHNTIWKVTQAGVASIVVGTAGSQSIQLGVLPGELYAPQGVAMASNRELYITTLSAVLTAGL